MTWQHMTLDVLLPNPKDPTRVEFRVNGRTAKDLPENFQFYVQIGEVLDSLGQVGWELVAAYPFPQAVKIQDYPAVERFLLKRAVPSVVDQVRGDVDQEAASS